MQEQFNSLEVQYPNYTAILDILTANTYVLIVVADPNVRKLAFMLLIPLQIADGGYSESAALRMNVRLARDKFEELQAGSVAS